ncbi:MAG: flagellar protein FlaG [Nitrospirae bacterium YQR-1]
MNINLGPLSSYASEWGKQPQKRDITVSEQEQRSGGQSTGDGKLNKALEKAPAEQSAELKENKAVFAVDENQKVVIRIVDSDGNLLKQIPAEEYVKMVQQLEQNSQNLFHKET